MTQIRRTVRPVRAHGPEFFDEQLWPVLISLIVLGSFVAGLTLTYLRFDDPRWYANAWTSLMADAAVVFVGAFLTAQVNQRMMRRAMQLSLVLCSIVHLILLVLLHEIHLFGQTYEATQNKLMERERPPVTMPDYAAHHFLDPHDRPPEDFEQPVETQTPEPEDDLVVRQQTQQREDVADRAVPVELAEATPQPQTLVRRERVESTTPRHSEETSKLSRKVAETTASSPAVVPVPEQRPSTPSEESLQASSQLAAKQATAALTQRAISQDEDQSSVAALAAPSSTRAENNARPEMTASTTSPRPMAKPNQLPRASRPVENIPPVARQTSSEALSPNVVATKKQLTAGPSPTDQLSESNPVAAPDLARRPMERQSPAEPTERVAQTPEPISAPRTRLTERPDSHIGAAAVESIQRATAPSALESPSLAELARSESPAAAIARTTMEPITDSSGNAMNAVRAIRSNTGLEQSTPPDPNSRPTNSRPPNSRAPSQIPKSRAVAERSLSLGPVEVARSSITPSLPSTTVEASNVAAARQSQDSPLANRQVQSADDSRANSESRQPSLQRARLDSQPSVFPDNSPTGARARSVRAFSLAASPAAVESPAAAVSDRGESDPTTEPARLAVTKSLSGTAGIGQSANMDRAVAAANSPAMTPSVAAQRERAMQDSPTGPALAPSDQSRVVRSKAGTDSPSTTLAVEVTPNGNEAAADRASQLLASSSASLTKADSNAQKGDVTAAKGTAELDTGTTRMIDEGGPGRAAGGGQVAINLNSQSRQIAKRRPGGTTQDTLSTPNTAELTSAHQASGGGSSRDALEAQSTQLGRSSNASEGRSEQLIAKQTDSGSRETGSTSEPNAADPRSRETRGSNRPGTSGTAGISGTGTGASSPVAATGDPVRQLGGELKAGAASRRAESVEAPRGIPEPGAGSASPTRSASAPAVVASNLAEVLEVGGASASSGDTSGIPLEVQGLVPTRTTGGVKRLNQDRIGALAGELVDALPQAGPGAIAESRRSELTSELGRNGDAVTPARISRSSAATLAADTLARIDFSKVESPSESSSGRTGRAPASPQLEPARVSQQRALTVEAQLPAGPGGLGELVAANVGLSNRRTSDESPLVDVSSSRFLKQDAGGLPRLSTSAVIPADAFRRRSARQPGNEPGQGAGRPGPQTEEAIELGLAFLARHQLPDGSWRLQATPGEEVVFFSDTAATALAILAFQGAGYNHREHKYAGVVFNGLDFLTKNQKENGDLYLPIDEETSKSAWLYSHSIAAIALCESYGMTQDPALREPAQKAVTFIVKAQDKELGGWRYAPNFGADTSVSGWMMMALKSGELAGLDVPKQSYERIVRWLDAAQVSSQTRHQYRYNPFAPDTARQRHGRQATKTMTAVGLLMRLYSGWKRDNVNLQQGGEYLLQNAPSMAERDTYYWYYATQVMFHLGGDTWDRWNGKLHPLLVNTQVKEGPLAGSWDPRRPVPDQWGPRVGRLYVTTMNLLSLEVYYRHLPLYVDVSK